jgi:hypothetical protein
MSSTRYIRLYDIQPVDDLRVTAYCDNSSHLSYWNLDRVIRRTLTKHGKAAKRDYADITRLVQKGCTQ